MIYCCRSTLNWTRETRSDDKSPPHFALKSETQQKKYGKSTDMWPGSANCHLAQSRWECGSSGQWPCSIYHSIPACLHAHNILAQTHKKQTNHAVQEKMMSSACLLHPLRYNEIAMASRTIGRRRERMPVDGTSPLGQAPTAHNGRSAA